jgi:hypothetical protein
MISRVQSFSTPPQPRNPPRVHPKAAQRVLEHPRHPLAAIRYRMQSPLGKRQGGMAYPICAANAAEDAANAAAAMQKKAILRGETPYGWRRGFPGIHPQSSANSPPLPSMRALDGRDREPTQCSVLNQTTHDESREYHPDRQENLPTNTQPTLPTDTQETVLRKEIVLVPPPGDLAGVAPVCVRRRSRLDSPPVTPAANGPGIAGRHPSVAVVHNRSVVYRTRRMLPRNVPPIVGCVFGGRGVFWGPGTAIGGRGIPV